MTLVVEYKNTYLSTRAECKHWVEQSTLSGTFLKYDKWEIDYIISVIQAPSSVCWSGTEDFFELNEDEITSILEAEDQYREGMPKIRRASLQHPLKPIPPRDEMAVNVRSFSEDN